MALVKMKPTSPGRRGMVKVVTEGLYKGRPFAALLEKKKTAGRNNNGHITTRHIGGGHRSTIVLLTSSAIRRYPSNRRNVLNTIQTVQRISLCCATPTVSVRTSSLLKVWLLAIKMNGFQAPIKSGGLPIRNIPVGTTMHCVEMLPGKGAQIARTAGAGVVLMAREGTLRSSSFCVLVKCVVSISNAVQQLAK